MKTLTGLVVLLLVSLSTQAHAFEIANPITKVEYITSLSGAKDTIVLEAFSEMDLDCKSHSNHPNILNFCTFKDSKSASVIVSSLDASASYSVSKIVLHPVDYKNSYSIDRIEFVSNIMGKTLTGIIDLNPNIGNPTPKHAVVVFLGWTRQHSVAKYPALIIK